PAPHVSSIIAKLNANDRTYAITLAIKRGAIQLWPFRRLSECRDNRPDRRGRSARQVSGLHASKRVLSGGAVSRCFCHSCHQLLVCGGIGGGQLQLDETVGRDRIDRVPAGQVRDLVTPGGPCLLNQEDRPIGGVQGADAPIGAVTVAARSLELDAQPSRLLGEGGRAGG